MDNVVVHDSVLGQARSFAFAATPGLILCVAGWALNTGVHEYNRDMVALGLILFISGALWMSLCAIALGVIVSQASVLLLTGGKKVKEGQVAVLVDRSGRVTRADIFGPGQTFRTFVRPYVLIKPCEGSCNRGFTGGDSIIRRLFIKATAAPAVGLMRGSPSAEVPELDISVPVDQHLSQLMPQVIAESDNDRQAMILEQGLSPVITAFYTERGFQITELKVSVEFA